MSLSALAAAYCPPVLRPAYDRIQASPLGTRLARGVFWSVAGTVISRGLMLVASVVVARMLGKTVYGELGMIQSTVGLFGVFAGFGLGLTAMKHVAEFHRSDPARAGRILGLSGALALASGGAMALSLVVVAPWLAEHTINAPQLAGALRIGALILFASAINGAQTGALSGFEAFRTIARVNLWAGLLAFPMLLAGAYWGGLTGVLWATALNLGVNWLLNHLALRQEAAGAGVPLTFRHCSREWPVLWRFSLPAVLAECMVGPVHWVCGALIVNQPGGYGEMGVFSAANQWFVVLLFLPTVIGNVVLPVLSSQLGQASDGQSMKTLTLAIKVNLLAVMPLVILGSLASPYIMSLYGPGFRAAWPTLVVVLLTAGLLAVQTPVGHVISASGRMWIGLAMNAVWALVFVVCTALLLHHGAWGLALARGIAYLVHSVWVIAFARSLFRK